MKKVVAILTLALLSFGNVWANPVTPATARQVAVTWMQAMGMRNTSVLVDVTSSTPFTEFYFFAAPDSGFILVSGDDCALPVIGYSLENSFPTKDIPQHLLSLLTGYEEEIRWCRQHPDDILDTVARQWQLLTHGQMPKAVYDHGVLPLLVTSWDQFPYYNDLCPLYDDTNHCLAGCTAVSMAQIMKYWNYPATGYGSHSYVSSFGTLSADFGATAYDWNHMPYRLTATSSAEEVEAVAKLMYHCGVSADMIYSDDGSYTVGETDLFAMCRYFKYRSDYSIIYRNELPDSVYYDLLRNDLDQGRPLIIYAYYSTDDAHAFNCDGYSTFNYFHFNLGWGGLANGYYIPSSIYSDYHNVPSLINHYVPIGIQPDNEWDSSATSTVSASPEGASATITGTGSFPFGTIASLKVSNVQQGFRFARWSDDDSDNPRQVAATGRDINLTAILEPIVGDTLSYCGTAVYKDRMHTNRWGIFLPKSLLANHDSLFAVQLYTIPDGTYTLKIFRGEYVDNLDQPLRTSSHYLSNEGFSHGQWHTLSLPSPLPIDTSTSLFIVIEAVSNDYYPAIATSYKGNIYGSLYGSNLQSYSVNYSWLIRGVFSMEDSAIDRCLSPLHVPYYTTTDSAVFNEYAACWTTLDADGDGHDWIIGPTRFASNSWVNDSALTPDNWLFSPAIELPDIPCSLSWWDRVNKKYPNEHFNLYISTTGTDTSDFTLLAEYTGDTSGLYVGRNISLDDWAGNTVHLAFRHFNSTDQNYVFIKDIRIEIQIDKSIDVYSNNSSWGSVTGSGSYPYGSSVTVEAIPFGGSTFQGWSNGVTDNPYTLTLTSDTVLTAMFLNATGIEDADYAGINIYVRNGQIIVEGAEGETVQVYDMEGRLVQDFETQVITTGIYMVRVGNRPALKVIFFDKQ